MADPSIAGEVLFARYAFPPNELGYCGTGDGRELLDLTSGIGAGPAEVAAHARRFDGAWPYLEMIASSSGIDDPLDVRVVEAYWVGNALLDAVDPAYFAGEVRRHFATQSGADWNSLDGVQPRSAVPHHCFHVFVIYPWMGILRRGHRGPALRVLDGCRIRWGQVVSVGNEHLQVSCQSLTWDGSTLGLGEPRVETARWADSGRSLSAAVTSGAWVSLHWDWVCDVLTAPQVEALRDFTTRQLERSNRSPST